MRLAIAICALLALGGCEVAQTAADDVTRSRAKKVVNQTLAQKAPGVDLSPITDCVIDQASTKEILKLASMSVTGVDQSTADLIFEIASRPETVRCIAQKGLPGIL